MLKPELGKTILDPACGSGGFLLNSLLQWKAEHTDADVLRLEWDGTPHDVLPVWPENAQPDFNSVLHGYDNDRTMVRIAWMNLILHGLESPEVHQLDSLSKRLSDAQSGTYDYILANPPFTGSVDEGDLSENRERFPRSGRGANPLTTKSELLFVWLMLDLLKIGGRAAVIVPDGVLFGGTNAHRALRRQLLFENTLEAVVSLPANMFQPYSGVKTSILLFQKAGTPVAKGDDPRTREVWFYEITDEAFSLDQKRKALYGQDNDMWDAMAKFNAWSRYRLGETASRAAAVATEYHQPAYWEERWRSVDDECLKIFPDKSGDKGHTYPLHELWPQDLPFDPADPRGARQYDDAVLARVRPGFAEAIRSLVETTVQHAYASASKPDAAKALAAAEKAAKAVATSLTKRIRDEGLLDREFDQFGQTALKTVLKEMTSQIGAWAATVPVPDKAPKTVPATPDPAAVTDALAPLLIEFAKLDGYNVWRRGADAPARPGKLTASVEGDPHRVTSSSRLSGKAAKRSSRRSLMSSAAAFTGPNSAPFSSNSGRLLMALHPLKLPRRSAALFRMVVLQKRLLKALADPALAPNSVNTTSLQGVWCSLDAEWVRKFCLGGQEGRMQTLARATLTARQALYDEFCRQNKVPKLLKAGGDFRDLQALPDLDASLARTVTEFFKDCYDLLGQASRTRGYTFRRGRVTTKTDYRQEFRQANLSKIVCPYCDGDIGTADLDHYYSKNRFPLLACSPWNLVPICKSCNDTTIAKGDRLALSPGPPRSTVGWLHPFECPASDNVRIVLTGSPRTAVPRLHSSDASEQRRLDNHHWLLDRLDQPNPSRYLSMRWTYVAAAHFDVLVERVNRRVNATNSIEKLLGIQLADHQAERGRAASSMVQAAVCQAILDQRPEYLEEFATPNPPALA